MAISMASVVLLSFLYESSRCCLSGCPGLGSTGGPPTGEDGLDPQVLWSRHFQGALEEPVRGAERRPPLYLGQGGEDTKT